MSSALLMNNSMNSFSHTSNGLKEHPRASPNEILARLWGEAVDDFITRTGLSEIEKRFFERCDNPEEIFDVTKYNWQKNINKKQLHSNRKGKMIVSQILGVFQVIDVALGLAQVVCILLKPMLTVGFPCSINLLRSHQNTATGSPLSFSC
jgi:hypothetical protein